MSRPTTLEILLDEITTPTIGMPVRLMQDVLERGAAAAPAVCDALERWREDEERDVLWLAVILGELRNPAAVPSLIELLGLSGELELPGAAAEALAKIGEPALPALLATLREGAPQERIWAYGSVGWIGGDAAYDALLEALERDAELVDVAATALAELGRRDAIPPIYRALEASEEWQRVDLEEAIRTIEHDRQGTSPLAEDWRLRYRRQPRPGSFLPAWPAIPASVHGDAELREARRGAPVRPLEEILAEPPEPESPPETCDDCGAPIEYPTGLPVCPETALAAAIRQLQLLNDGQERGLEDLFELWDDVVAGILLLEEDEEEHPEQRERWELERDELAIEWQTCEWLISQDIETIGAAKALLLAEAARLADRFGDPDGLLRPLRRAPAPEARVGRNDPCPCGSGKKYKRCCGAPGAAGAGSGTAARAPATAETTVERRMNERLWRELLKFARGKEVAKEMPRALECWEGGASAEGEEPLASRRAADALPVPDWAEPPFWEWLLLDFQLESGETLLERYRARHAGRLDARAAAVLDKLAASRLSLYEVVEVRRDEGLTLRDLFLGGTVEVRERAGTHSLVRWDLLAARLIELDGVTVMSGGAFLFRARDREDLLTSLEEEYRRFGRKHRDATRADFLKERGEWFYRRALARLEAPLPRLLTAEGDELLFCRAHYRLTDRAAALAALRSEPALEEYEKEPCSFGWYEAREGQVPHLPEGVEGADESLILESSGGELLRSLGHVELRRDRLILECMSRQRLERGKALLERCAGRSIAYQGESVQDPWQAAKGSRGRRRKREDDLPPEVERELLHDYLDRHYRSWPDEPLPALDGLTPRQAARTPDGRRRVADLLRTIENSQARERLERGDAYDVSWLWDELDLDPTE